ncbi:hypothetical protein VBD025_14955 [Virgibacillus flavescens]|uniref:hypothetical protein n=1 Tax=Virgibacillus flavescens TaxID=1611422 RepID=UPI003D32D59E
MKKIGVSILFVFILYSFTGCNNPSAKITKEEAESIVMEHHSEQIIITSVSHKRGNYIVKWEIDPDCEFGTYYINDQNGKIEKGQVTNC